MNYKIPYQTLAAEGYYNCGTYGAGNYNETACSAASDDIAGTGLNMILIFLIGAILLIGSLAYIFNNIRKNRAASK